MANYLICDVDDTLIRTDLLFEQWLLLARTSPSYIFISFFWLFQGIHYFKTKIAEKTFFNAQLLPYRMDIIDYIKRWRTEQKGPVILMSASPEVWIQSISEQLKIFDLAIGSANGTNLKGHAKINRIRAIVKAESFTYIGDSSADLEVWKYADGIVAVNPSSSVKKKLTILNKNAFFIHDKVKIIPTLIKQLRPHQWVKNFLVFLPLLTAHRINDLNLVLKALTSFAIFSVAASVVYLLNDLVDLNSDRSHISKKNRPLAAGNLPIKTALLLVPFSILILGGMLICSNIQLGFIIVFYLLLNIIYSLKLKKIVIFDVVILSVMYTLRIFAGSAAVNIEISQWLLNFSILLFFSLACIKRCTELFNSRDKSEIDGRGYKQIDFNVVMALGVCAGLISILVALLYFQSAEVKILYSPKP